MTLARLRDVNTGGARLSLWCPGCDDIHQVQVARDDGNIATGGEWEWNRDLVKVTISPSILVTGVQWEPSSPFHRRRHKVAPGEPVRCHSFVTGGNWQFLGDSTHELAGRTVPLVPLPAWFED